LRIKLISICILLTYGCTSSSPRIAVDPSSISDQDEYNKAYDSCINLAMTIDLNNEQSAKTLAGAATGAAVVGGVAMAVAGAIFAPAIPFIIAGAAAGGVVVVLVVADGMPGGGWTGAAASAARGFASGGDDAGAAGAAAGCSMVSDTAVVVAVADSSDAFEVAAAEATASKITNLKFLNGTSYVLTSLLVIGTVLGRVREEGTFADDYLWMKYQVRHKL